MQAGDKLGHFVIQKKLGAGGMGEVYLAEDQRLGRQVAIKVLPSNLSEDAGSRARFDLEARAASALSHPNIAHIYDVGEEGGTHFIAMEYVEGADLGQRISGKGLTEDEILKIAIQVAGALEEARGKGIVHRDIKPANIALTTRGEVKVLDFGLAKMTSIPGQESAGQTLTVGQTTAGSVLGTVRYMSPEQALSKEIDTRSDLFSLGVVLFEMVAGRPPFSGTGPVETLDCIIHSQPEALARFNYEVSPELERIILKCLEKNPENRYQTPRDLLVDLRNLRQKASSSSVAAAHLSSVRPPRKRGLRFLPGILAVAVVAVAVGVYFLAPRASADVNSLAILPFENETGDPDVDYLCNGVTETLINTLSQYQDLRVISRRSAFALQGKGLDAESVGKELKVEAVLYGRVVQREDELTISTELVDTRDSRQLWGSRYSRPASEIQSIENEITHSIADKLQVGLTMEDDENTSRQKTWNPDAYRFYLKGREFTTGTMREMDKAIEFFEDAIALEPEYALAYTGLAQAYITQSYLRGHGRDQSMEGARAAAQKAMELDPGLAEAYTARGLVRLYFDLDWEGARADLTRGLELAPGDVETLMAYGDFLAMEGRYEESLAVHERALERDPLSISTAHDLGFINMARKNYEQSEYYFKMALDLSPNWAWGHIKLAKTYSHMGRCQEALAETELAEDIVTGSESPSARSWLAFTYARCGEEGRARAALADLQKRSETDYVDPGLYAIIYLGLGELEPAIQALQQSLAERSPSLVYYKMIPNLYLDELGDDPRFQAMRKEIGFD